MYVECRSLLQRTCPLCDKTTLQHSESCVCVEFVPSFRSGAAAASVFRGGCVWWEGAPLSRALGWNKASRRGGFWLANPCTGPRPARTQALQSPDKRISCTPSFHTGRAGGRLEQQNTSSWSSLKTPEIYGRQPSQTELYMPRCRLWVGRV